MAIALLLSPTAAVLGQIKTPVPARDTESKSLGHAHNDYLHPRPLHDALDQGFASVEVDIFLQGNQLLVGHDRSQLRPERTIESLYLKPLQKIVQSNSGFVVSERAPFILLVDIKTNGKATYAKLHEILEKYNHMLTEVREGKIDSRPITVVISGNRPTSELKAQPVRWAGVDGRIADLGMNNPPHLMPLISDHWGKHFVWRGIGPFPEKEKHRLHNWVATAHRNGQLVRFWATPESPAIWKELQQAKVDLINTDKLSKLATFLKDDRARD